MNRAVIPMLVGRESGVVAHDNSAVRASHPSLAAVLYVFLILS